MSALTPISPHVVALRIPFRIPAGPGAGLDRFVYAFVLLGERVWLLDTGVAGSEQLLLQMELTRATVDRLGLPPSFANPMVARTVMSHYRWREREALF